MELKLYEIKDFKYDTLECFDCIEDEEERKEAEEMLNKQILALATEKSPSLIGVVKNYNANIDAVHNEIERLKKIETSLKNKKDKFIAYVDSNMRALEIDEIETSIGKIKYRKSPLSVEIPEDKVQDLPINCVKQEMTIKADKEAIKDLYKKGVVLPGVIYKDNEKKLVIG